MHLQVGCSGGAMLSRLDAYRSVRMASCCRNTRVDGAAGRAWDQACIVIPGCAACTADSEALVTAPLRTDGCFFAFAGLGNISHLPPATGPDKQPTNVVRVSNALKHK